MSNQNEAKKNVYVADFLGALLSPSQRVPALYNEVFNAIDNGQEVDLSGLNQLPEKGISKNLLKACYVANRYLENHYMNGDRQFQSAKGLLAECMAYNKCYALRSLDAKEDNCRFYEKGVLECNEGADNAIEILAQHEKEREAEEVADSI